MKEYRIPKENSDLRRYAVLKQVKRAVGFLAYCATFALAYHFYLQGALREPLPPLFLAIFIAAVVISGVMIFRFDRLFTDKSVSGKIVSIEVTRSYGRGMNRRAGFSLDFHTYNNITLTDGGGRRHRIKVQLFDDGFDGYYREGETIAAFRGLNYPLSLDAEGRGEHICTVCGVRCYDRDRGEEGLIRKGEDGLCPSCRRTMIDSKEIIR